MGKPAKRGPKPKGPTDPIAKAAIPDPPANLDAAAKSHWKRLTVLLAEAGLVAKLDRDVLVLYIETWSTRDQAERKLKEKGGRGRVIVAPNGYEQVNPWHTISVGALKDLRSLLPMLGLSPAARAKLAMPEPEKVDPKWKEPP